MPFSRYSTQDIEEMKRLRSEGWELQKIADKFKCHNSLVYRFIKGMDLGAWGGRIRLEKSTGKMIELYLQGKKMREIAEVVGLTVGGVWLRLKTFYPEFRENRPPKVPHQKKKKRITEDKSKKEERKARRKALKERLKWEKFMRDMRARKPSDESRRNKTVNTEHLGLDGRVYGQDYNKIIAKKGIKWRKPDGFSDWL